MKHLTPEERAKIAFPHPIVTDIGYKNMRIGYATCIREEVEPREDHIFDLEAQVELNDQEVVKLRALVQTLVNGLHAVSALADVDTDERSTIARDPLDAAKQQGFVPTNSTEE